MSDEYASSGETAGRPRPWVAAVLSIIAPGLGLVYVGRLVVGMVVNLLFVLLVLLFVIAVSTLQFFPLYSGAVLLATWVIFGVLSAWRAMEIIDRTKGRKKRAFQHPLIYVLVAVATFLAPLAMTAHFTHQHLLTVVPVKGDAMYPQAHPGDHLLIDRTGYYNRPPRHGDPVAIRHPHSDELVVLRVVAVPSDVIELHGYMLAINDQPVGYGPLNSPDETGGNGESVELWIEDNHDRQYVISIVPGAEVGNSALEAMLGEDQYFVLADNRSLPDGADRSSQVTDSRTFGAISRERIEGRPTYVAWSQPPGGDRPRWDRIGLPTE